MIKTISITCISLITLLFVSLAFANNKVVVIPLGGDNADLLERTVYVTGGGNAIENGAALIAAFTLVANKNPTVTDPWLIKLEPGRFDIGSGVLNLSSGMHIEGSGIDASHILGQTSFAVISINSLASSISSLTVENTQGAGFVIYGPATSNYRIYNAKVETNGATAILSDGTGTGVLEVVNSTIKLASGNNLRVLNTRQTVNVDSSRIMGIETGSSGLIDNFSGTVTISNSFIEDETNVVGGTGTIVCRGIASPGAFYTSTCPGQ